MNIIPFPINKNSPVPIYHQIYNGIIEQIHNGEFSPNDQLPSENELSQQYGISPMTVRQAMRELVEKGYIYRVRGRGTFIAPRFLKHDLNQLVSFSEDIQSRNLIPGAKILIFERVECPSDIANYLKIREKTNILRIKRLRFANGEPVGIHDVYLSGVNFSKTILEEKKSLYSVLESIGIILTEGEDILEAIEANKEYSEILKVHLGAPLLQMTRTSQDSTGRTVEYVKAVYIADLYRYAIKLTR